MTSSSKISSVYSAEKILLLNTTILRGAYPRVRFNKNAPLDTFLRLHKFFNQISLIKLSYDEASEEKANLFTLAREIKKMEQRMQFSMVAGAKIFDGEVDGETMWRFMSEVETNQGSIVLKIPLYSQEVQQLVQHCKNLER